MAGSHDGRVCLCDRADGTCAGLAVRRLSPARVQELAEEIWTASSGDLLPARPAADPRSSRAGASAQAAYRRRREQERESWRLDWVWLIWGVVGAASAAGLLLGVTVGAWLGWPTALAVAVGTWWRLRFRPSAEAAMWRRQATMQRRTAGRLRPLVDEGWLVLHDVTLPGWLEGLEHLAVGPSGVWVVQSWQRHRRLPAGAAVPAGILGELRSQTQAISDLLGGGVWVPVRGLLCVHRSWARRPWSVQRVRVATPRQLVRVVRQEPSVVPGEVERVSGRLLEVLRPAA